MRLLASLSPPHAIYVLWLQCLSAKEMLADVDQPFLHGFSGSLGFLQKMLWFLWTVADWPFIGWCLHSFVASAIWQCQLHDANALLAVYRGRILITTVRGAVFPQGVFSHWPPQILTCTENSKCVKLYSRHIGVRGPFIYSHPSQGLD